jgi:hypothetical protein
MMMKIVLLKVNDFPRDCRGCGGSVSGCRVHRLHHHHTLILIKIITDSLSGDPRDSSQNAICVAIRVS